MNKFLLILPFLAVSFAFSDPNIDLDKAIKSRDIEAVKTALDQGANPRQVDFHDHTWIHAAIFANFPEAITLLADAGAYVDAKNEFGQTALHITVMNSQLDMAIVLCTMRAQAHLVDRFGRRPLDVARQYRRQNMVTLLEEYMATIDHAAPLFAPGRVLDLLLPNIKQ